MQGSILLVRPSQAAAFAAALLLSFHLYAADPPPRSREVRELIQEADAAAERLDVDRARELWAQVYELEHSTMALCQLGQLDRRVGRFEEAAEKLSKCADQMPPPVNANQRRRHDARLADLAAVRLRVGELHVIPPPGAIRILIDGKAVNASGPTYVKPGQHEVMATGRHGQEARARVTIEAGEAQSVPLTFEIQPATLAPRAAVRSPVAPTPARPELKPWIVGVGALTAATLFVTGVELHMASNAAYEDARAKKERERTEHICPCSVEYQQLREDVMGTRARAETMDVVGWAALVAGELVGVATVLYVVLPRGAQIQAQANGAKVRLEW